MGVDGKYGRVTTEFGTIGESEPVVVFRAQDELLYPLLKRYRLLCEQAGSPEHHLARIDDTIDQVTSWQEQEGHHTQVPNSDTYVERLKKSL